MTPGRRLSAALVGLVVLVVLGWVFKDLSSDGTSSPSSSSPSAAARSTSNVAGGEHIETSGESKYAVKALSSLPKEAADTWKLIESSGPFPYPRNDGVEFQNREKHLPSKSGGYYKEFTVPTPGSPDRGERRLITGNQQEVYYTSDHYGSFVLVDVRK